MDIFHTLLIYAALPFIAGLVGFIMRSYANKLDALEKEIRTKLDEFEVRQIVGDKVDPIREDVKEIKAKLDKIMDILLKN